MSLYALWVEFEIRPDDVASFREAVMANARASVAVEPGCQRFDVLEALPAAPAFYLYEIYDDEAAFKAHLQTAHFKTFDGLTAPWIAKRSIRFGAVTQIAKS
jgi:autoinducer 2-degrading protein